MPFCLILCCTEFQDVVTLHTMVLFKVWMVYQKDVLSTRKTVHSLLNGDVF